MLTPRDIAALACFAGAVALLVVAFARRRSTGRWFPLLVAALVVSGCCSRPAPTYERVKPPPRPYAFTRYDADGRHEDVWTEFDAAGGWIQRSHGWQAAP